MLDPSRPPATLPEMMQRSIRTFAARPCLGSKAKKGADYSYLTYEEVGARVRNVALGLLERGLERGERIAILSDSRPEWAICDLAAQMCGLITVPLFPALPGGQIVPILQDCGARLLWVSGASQLKKVASARAELPELHHVLLFDADTKEGEAMGDGTLAELETKGEGYARANPTTYEATWPATQADDVATIIYTSGTTGEPKGVMLTHRNLLANVEAINKALEEAFGAARDEVFLSILPLAHVYERTAGYYWPLRIGAAIAYAESLFTIDKNLREVRPTIMFCVPRLYESLRDKQKDFAKTLPEDKRAKYLDALHLAAKAGAKKGHVQGALTLSLPEKIKYLIYERAVYRPVRERLGGRLKAFVSGGAPMSADLAAPFLGMGIEILEGYGLTETAPVIAVNRPGRVRLGTVGEVMDTVEVKIASDGEICTRGPSVMKGYWEKPQATKEAIDEEGWFHTGDIGELKGNVLRITDRKKDLLVLGNGKKVAPAPIESKIAESSLIAQAVLLGDSAKGITALIVPDFKALRAALGDQVPADTDDEALAVLPEARTKLRQEIDKTTPHLADFEKVRAFAVVPHPFSVDAGELTPTLKVKRRVVSEKYGNLLK